MSAFGMYKEATESINPNGGSIKIKRSIVRNQLVKINKEWSPYPAGFTYEQVWFVGKLSILVIVLLSMMTILLATFSALRLLSLFVFALAVMFSVHNFSTIVSGAYRKYRKTSPYTSALYIVVSNLILSVLLTLTVALVIIATRQVLLIRYEFLWATIYVTLVFLYLGAYIQTDFNARTFKKSVDKISLYTSNGADDSSTFKEYLDWKKNWIT